MADDGAIQRSLGVQRGTVVRLHHTLEALSALKGHWDDLAAEVDASASLTHDYAATAWRLIAERNDVKLNVISVEANGELVAVWPLYVETIGAVRVAKHLGSSADEEYAGPLVADGHEAEQAVTQMIAAIRPRADVLKVYNVMPGQPAGRVLDRLGGLKHRSSVHSPIVSPPTDGKWETWLAAKSKSFRTELRYKRNKLSQLGEIRFCRVEGRQELERVVGWIFEVKRASLLAHNNTTSWAHAPYGEAFFARAAQASERVNVYALMVGDQMAAAAILFEAPGLMEYFMTSYNHDLHVYTPGNLLLEELVKKAFSTGSAFDFRITTDEIKERWRDRTQRYDSYIVPTSLRGLLPTMAAISHRAEVDMKIAIKARMKAMKKRKAQTKKAAPGRS